MASRKADVIYGYFDSPVGRLLVAADAEGLLSIRFPTEKQVYRPQEHWRQDSQAFAEVFEQLQAYFTGELTRFALPVRFGGTDFQNRVWKILCAIPFGETISYQTLATRMGNPKASRAVGRAIGANPLPIIVPCHRVIGTNGSLTGFAGGLPIKKFLLEHERRISSSGCNHES